jgi:sugar phosphate isomerase/epimerase
MDQLCVHRTMTLFDWIEAAAGLGVDGLEMYAGFFLSFDEPYLRQVRSALQAQGFAMPMFCYSPDFTHPDPEHRRREVEKQRQMIAVTAFLGGGSCRVLSGQRRPEVSLEQGLDYVQEAIESLLPYAEQQGVRLVIENHYKDNYWTWPEFAQKQDVFCALVERIQSPWFGVQYDPSNAILAGDDPIALLQKVKHRVLTMHASDRFLLPGHTLEELRAVENVEGYAAILSHGVVGRGLNDYNAIFSILAEVGYRGWISIEDGMNGLDEIRQSAEFLREKIAQYLTS